MTNRQPTVDLFFMENAMQAKCVEFWTGEMFRQDGVKDIMEDLGGFTPGELMALWMSLETDGPYAEIRDKCRQKGMIWRSSGRWKPGVATVIRAQVTALGELEPLPSEE